jgi:hypothetical protein
LIFDENHDHYLWMSIGWINKKKINNTQIHIRITNEKFYTALCVFKTYNNSSGQNNCGDEQTRSGM